MLEEVVRGNAFFGVVARAPLPVQPDLVFDQGEEQSCFFYFSPKKSRGKGSDRLSPVQAGEEGCDFLGLRNLLKSSNVIE